MFEPTEGVRIRIGNKEKNPTGVSRRSKLMDIGLTRMSRGEYLSMLDEKGLQNQALGIVL